MLADLPVRSLLEELAAPSGPPAGGSALALAAAAAAAVLEMCAHDARESWTEAAGIAAQAGVLRERALELVQTDADAYRRALDVRAAVESLPAGRRDDAVGRAYAAAAEPPLAIAAVASDLADLARLALRHVGDALRPDAAASLALAAAAARGAHALVAANLTALPEDERVARASRLAAAAAEPA